MSVKHWVELLRIHTAALTSSVLVLGYVLAGNPLFSLKSVVWWLWGVLFHAAGFLNNNLMDYRYDKLDPHKSHFPLVRGDVGYEAAVQLDCVLLTAMGIAGALLSNANPVALLFLAVCTASGFAYNWISKVSLLAPIPISACFGLLIGFPYFAEGGELNVLISLSLAFWLATIAYQIAYSGYYKDMLSDKVNLLRRLGARVLRGTRFVPTRATKAFGRSLTAVKVALAVAIACAVGSVNLAMSLPFTLLMIWLVVRQTREHRFRQGTATRICALVEMSTYYAYAAAILGPVEALVMILLPTAWFVGVSTYYWGKEWAIGPKV